MGEWIVRTVPPRDLDMPAPKELVTERALPGWVWRTTQGENMELIRYSRNKATWRDPQGHLIEIEPGNGQGQSVEATK
jgi:erythromycin esterase-like protein